MTVPVRWVTIFLDRPSDSIGAAADFWGHVTGCSRSAARGRHLEFTTLVPADGDAHVRLQRLHDGAPGTHLDLHSDDPAALVRHALELGAVPIATDPVPVLASPGGYRWCAVGWHGETTPALPHQRPGAAPSRLDQVCLDVAPAHVDDEVRFWAALLGWPAVPSALRPEFTSLTRPPGMPVRLLLQRRDEGDGPTTGHVDLAAGPHVDAVVEGHVAAGAEVLTRGPIWTVLRDPSGARYCVTPRDPVRGVLTHPPTSTG